MELVIAVADLSRVSCLSTRRCDVRTRQCYWCSGRSRTRVFTNPVGTVALGRALRRICVTRDRSTAEKVPLTCTNRWRWRESNPRLPSPCRGFSERSR